MSAPTKWDRMRFNAFDLETTGVDVFNDRIIQAAFITVEAGQVVDKTTWLVDPDVEISEDATAVHGYTAERLAAEATHSVAQMLFEVTGRLALGMGRVIPTVVANAPYDLTLLEAENARHGIDSLGSRLVPKPVGPVIDPMVLDKHVDPYRKGICENNRVPCRCGAVDKTLSSLCLHYGVQLDGAHDAGADALAAALLVPKIIARHSGKFRGFTVGALHQAQIGWAREQKDSLRKYFDRNGIEHDGCDPSWPLRVKPVVNAAPQEALL